MDVCMYVYNNSVGHLRKVRFPLSDGCQFQNWLSVAVKSNILPFSSCFVQTDSFVKTRIRHDT